MIAITKKTKKSFLDELCYLYFDIGEPARIAKLLRSEGYLPEKRFVSIYETRAIAGEILVGNGIDSATPPPNDYPYWLDKLQEVITACATPSEYKSWCSHVIPEYESVGGKLWEYRDGHGRRNIVIDQWSTMLLLQDIGKNLHSRFSVQYPSYKFHLDIPSTVKFELFRQWHEGIVLPHNSCQNFLVLKQKVNLALKTNHLTQQKVISIQGVPMILARSSNGLPWKPVWKPSIWNIDFI
ncbi:hypothetical protein JYQ62_16050 [Nostoc sp. UHCC 0702]|nr:hypothetical protein JYQ62_16050 [Nostoc sp. UHCC 0702]